jgi:hypothetical protein
MNGCFFLIILIVVLAAYLLYFKEKLIKWEDRDSVEKSFSIRFIVLLIVGIILLTYKILKENNLL